MCAGEGEEGKPHRDNHDTQQNGGVDTRRGNVDRVELPYLTHGPTRSREGGTRIKGTEIKNDIPEIEKQR